MRCVCFFDDGGGASLSSDDDDDEDEDEDDEEEDEDVDGERALRFLCFLVLGGGGDDSSFTLISLRFLGFDGGDAGSAITSGCSVSPGFFILQFENIAYR